MYLHETEDFGVTATLLIIRFETNSAVELKHVHYI